MSLLQPVPKACQNECSDTGTSAIPGPMGPAGAAGSNGINGISAVTYVAAMDPAQPVMPDEGDSVTVDVKGDTAAFGVGNLVFVEGWGTMIIDSLPTGFQMILINAEDTALDLYPDNAAPGTSLPEDNKIVPTGAQGSPGTAAGGGLIAANNLSDLVDVPTARNNLSLGDAAQATLGVGTAEVAQNDSPLTAGDVVVATATGIETADAAAVSTFLGLGSMAVQDANNVNIQGGVYNGQIGVTTPDTAVFDSFTAQGNASLESNLTVTGKTFLPMSALQSLTVGNTISPNASKVRVEGSGGPVTLTSTPTITNPAADGQILILEGNSDVNTLTLQDQSALGGSNLNLAGGAAAVLGQGDILMLTWSTVMGTWNEICRSNN